MHKFRTILLLMALMLGLTSCNSCQETTSANEDGFSFAFLTDIHVQKQKLADKGFEKAIESVNKQLPDFVITGGDLIMDALCESEEYASELYTLYTGLEEELTMPVYNTLGNHELFGIYERSGVTPAHPLYAEGMYEKFIGQSYYAFESNGWRFYILDSVEETEDRQYTGYIDSVQIAWIREDLENVDTSTPVVISTHIPFITALSQIRGGSMASNSEGLVVGNSREVLDLFEQHNLRLVLQGHLHILEDVYIDGIHFITGGAVCGRWWNGPNGDLEEGYLMVNVTGDEIDWEYVDYGWNAVTERQQ